MKTSNKAVALAVTSAFVLSIGAATINAAENPFAIKSLSKGYQVADHHEEGKMKDGKCGEGKCGAEMKKDGAAKAKDGKCGEGKCGAEMKKNGAKTDAKMKDGQCGAEKGKDGSCGH